MSTPAAVRFLTYNGNVTEIVGQVVMGPTTLGEYLTPVSAIYDPETNKTKVGFAYGDHRTNDEAVSA